MASYLALIAGRLKSLAAVVSSAGSADAGKIPALGATGKLDGTLLPQISHDSLSGRAADDHPQYHTDARGDARYEPKNTNIQAHIASAANPHGTTAAQVGAYTTAQADALLAGKQAADADLTAVAGLTGAGILVRTGNAGAAVRTLLYQSGITIYNPDGVATNPLITNSDKGSDARAAHEAAGDPHAQYHTDARGDARYLKRAGDLSPGPQIFTTSPTGTLSDVAGDAPLEVRGGSASGHAYLLFHSPNAFAQKFGMDAAGDLYVGSFSRGSVKLKVWRDGDQHARNQRITIAQGATGVFEQRSTNGGAGFYVLTLWQGYCAVFSTHYPGGGNWAGFDNIFRGSRVLYQDTVPPAGYLAVYMDPSYRINVYNNYGYSVSPSLFSVV
ncbi:MAG: hypothetical protein WBE39_05315 [Candidatus Competibacter sp.]